MSARDVFSVQELAQLRGFPGISAEELIRFFTLSGADEAFVRSMRQPATMLGVAVQLCSLPWLGFVPDDVAAAPVVAVARLAARLGISTGELAGYGRREQTRTDHLRAVMTYLGWRTADGLSLKELDEFLLARAMEHDSPGLLFRLACAHLITSSRLLDRRAPRSEPLPPAAWQGPARRCAPRLLARRRAPDRS